MGALFWHPQTKNVYCVIRPLCKWEQGSLLPLPGSCGAGVPIPTGAVTSLRRCPAGPTPGQQPAHVLHPPFVPPFPISVQPGQPLPASCLLVRPQNCSLLHPTLTPYLLAGLHLQGGDWCSYRAWRGVEGVSGRSLWVSGTRYLFLYPPVGDGPPDLKGYPGKLPELQAGKESFLQIPQLVEEEVSTLL